jgi:predicted ABC-type sugar transport system permease subunit
VFGLAALAVTAFFGASAGASMASALPFERAGDGAAFFVGFLVLDAAMVIISVWEILKTVYIVCPVSYATWWARDELESCPQILFRRV